MKNFCECGCGQEVKNRFARGHHIRVEGNYLHNPEIYQKISNSVRVFFNSKKGSVIKKQLSERNKADWKRESYRENFSSKYSKTRAEYPERFFVGGLSFSSIFYKTLKDLLVPLGYVTEYCIKKPIRRYIDFALLKEKIAIECDGPIHRKSKGQELDRKKTKLLKSLGWRVIRVSHD